MHGKLIEYESYSYSKLYLDVSGDLYQSVSNNSSCDIKTETMVTMVNVCKVKVKANPSHFS